MFIGHFGLGFGAKRVAPAVSLGALFLACQFADLLWPTLVILGVERVAIEPGATVVTPLRFISYPYSHSLLMLCAWGILLGVAYAVATRSRAAAAVLALLVVSHWVLDVITHRPDLPLTPIGDPRVGLNLWSSLAGTLLVEFAIFGAGVLVYARATAPRDRIGSIGLWTLVAFLVLIMVANLFGPPPPSVAAVAWSAQAIWLLVFWGYWIDRHRRPALSVMR
jgi:membrane-bound metal-dependent hydrolase YbcI (DUF457 family)